ncbi:MAG: hypothetical protein JNK15_13715 [Planctomycetes bacterium]|nr:hypothetical protein [Planctomycetota bacterium]
MNPIRSAFRSLLLLCVVFALPALAAAQVQAEEQFRTELGKALELGDEKLVDKAVKRAPVAAMNVFELLWDERAGNREEAKKRADAIQAAWPRCFEGSDTIDQIDRWRSGATATTRESLEHGRTQLRKLWSHYVDVVSKGFTKAEYEQAFQQMMELARNAEAVGHLKDTAEIWNLASVIGNRMPEKNLANRRDVVFAIDQFLEARKRLKFAFGPEYLSSEEFAKSERAKIEADEKAGDKRKAEGYDPNSKGVDSLVMPNVTAQKHSFKFEALPNVDELDYGAKGGPVPPFWWLVSLEKEGTARKLEWFRRKDVFLHRTGATKAVIAGTAVDAKGGFEVDISNKGKVSTFWLDADKQTPYAMAFWTGTDRQFVNEAECNLAPADTVCNVHYRSAASWKGTIGADPVVFYDDSCDGRFGDADPYGAELKQPNLGAHDTEGTVVPLLDSMRVGKGPRVPYSEFVKLTPGWFHIKKGPGDDVAVRPLNPEYVKTGKIKLVWSGPKPTAPVQLVVRGGGDYRTAMFDVAGGKEIEVPAAEYTVIWGRMMIGKGARAQVANLYQGEAKPFTVEAGKTFDLKMGGPFELTFTRRGDESVSLDALKVVLAESSGCVFGDLHGMSLACEVMAAKEADGKGAKLVGKFVRFTDPELVNVAQKTHKNIGNPIACFPMPDGYRTGEMVLTFKLAAGMKVGLVQKKHPIFGELKTVWK